MLVYFPPRIIEANSADEAVHKYTRMGICIPREDDDLKDIQKVVAFSRIIPYPDNK